MTLQSAPCLQPVYLLLHLFPIVLQTAFSFSHLLCMQTFALAPHQSLLAPAREALRHLAMTQRTGLEVRTGDYTLDLCLPTEPNDTLPAPILSKQSVH
jgi:hypothetical protein